MAAGEAGHARERHYAAVLDLEAALRAAAASARSLSGRLGGDFIGGSRTSQGCLPAWRARPLLLTVAPGTRRRNRCRCARGCRSLHVRRGRIGLRVLDYAQARYVFQVLIVAFGEDVTAGAVRDKVDFLGARRIGCGFE